MTFNDTFIWWRMLTSPRLIGVANVSGTHATVGDVVAETELRMLADN